MGDFLPGFSLEGYPNRDSTIYSELYGINSADTILRGTLRYKGYVDAVKGLVKLGLLDPNPTPVLHENGPELTWKQYMCHLMNQTDNIFYDNLVSILEDRLGNKQTLKVIEDLGLLSDEPIAKGGSPLDTVSNHLAKRLSYEKDERDMILMRHEVTVRWPDGRRELKGINLVHYASLMDTLPWRKLWATLVLLLPRWFWMERYRGREWFYPSARTSTDQS